MGEALIIVLARRWGNLALREAGGSARGFLAKGFPAVGRAGLKAGHRLGQGFASGLIVPLC
ncbi:MAG TPA: hypothetical protein DD643_06710 [Synechococcus sp. UBA8638]|nr:hypothetical protein [Synechococcus sp. UBA8638]